MKLTHGIYQQCEKEGKVNKNLFEINTTAYFEICSRVEVFAITITINGKGPHIVLGRNANSIYPWHSGGAPIKRDSKEN